MLVLQIQLPDSSRETLSTLQTVADDLPRLMTGMGLIYKSLKSVVGSDGDSSADSTPAASRPTSPEPDSSRPHVSANDFTVADIDVQTMAAQLGTMSNLLASMSATVEVKSLSLSRVYVHLHAHILSFCL